MRYARYGFALPLTADAQCILLNSTDFAAGSGPIYTVPYECPQGLIHCDAGSNGNFAQGDAYIKNNHPFANATVVLSEYTTGSDASLTISLLKQIV